LLLVPVRLLLTVPDADREGLAELHAVVHAESEVLKLSVWELLARLVVEGEVPLAVPVLLRDTVLEMQPVAVPELAEHDAVALLVAVPLPLRLPDAQLQPVLEADSLAATVADSELLAFVDGE
jgi:hypothetical protein